MDRKFTELTREECLVLLRQQETGRIAMVVEDQPFIFPVNYALDGDHVIFRSDPGMKLSHSTVHRVAFEIDSANADTRQGWSVHITGVAVEITNAIDDESARQLEIPLQPWATGEKAHWVRISNPAITGRRLS